ncbi:MAG: hypothetical protein WCT32_03885 [Patescibacteria group bacterium]|jgi:hypothetical protein
MDERKYCALNGEGTEGDGGLDKELSQDREVASARAGELESAQERSREDKDVLRGRPEIRIITDSAPIREALERATMLLPEGTEGTLVFSEMLVDGGKRTDMIGLDEALKFAPDGKPVIVLSWSPEIQLANDKRYHALRSYSNVHFARLPLSLVDMKAILLGEVENETRPSDPLALRLMEVPNAETAVGALQHDLRYALAQGGDKMVAWERLARLVFGDLPQEELIRLTQMERAEANKRITPLAGEEFPDLCIDIEGTLLDENGELNPDVVALIEERSGEQPITIWTGSDVKALRTKIRQKGLKWKVVSKYQLRGAKVAGAVDDLPYEEFVSEYGVEVGEYNQLAPTQAELE